MILVHGPYGAGKTHLQGDFLTWAKAQGPIGFLNILGEDGYASVAGLNLGEVGYTATDVKEYEEALADFKKQGLVGLAIDSLSAFYRFVLKDIVGEVRYP